MDEFESISNDFQLEESSAENKNVLSLISWEDNKSPPRKQSQSQIDDLEIISDAYFEPKKRRSSTENIEAAPKSSQCKSLANKKIPCQFCSKLLKNSFCTKRHESNCLFNPHAARKQFNCEHCGLAFTRRDNMTSHSKDCLSREATKRTRTPCNYPNCEVTFFTKAKLIEHIRSVHDASSIQETQFKEFNNIGEFERWKEEEEHRTYSFFSRKCGEIKRTRTRYYYCQHDGSAKAHEKVDENPRKRIKTSRRRIKLGNHCIASMVVKTPDSGGVSVIYYPTHSHELSSKDLEHHRLSEATYRFIDKLIALQLNPEDIQREVKNRVSLLEAKVGKEHKDCLVTTDLIVRRAKKLRLHQSPPPIEDSHEKGLEISDAFVVSLSENLWLMKSSSDPEVFYEVIKWRDKCNSDQCYCKCTVAQCQDLCPHLYHCSCSEPELLCKHVHKIHSFIQRGNVRPQEDIDINIEDIFKTVLDLGNEFFFEP